MQVTGVRELMRYRTPDHARLADYDKDWVFTLRDLWAERHDLTTLGEPLRRLLK